MSSFKVKVLGKDFEVTLPSGKKITGTGSNAGDALLKGNEAAYASGEISSAYGMCNVCFSVAEKGPCPHNCTGTVV